MKYIFVLRHAKAAHAGPALDDHQRPLTPQGHEAARLMGEWANSQKLIPDTVLCSDAKRTKETWEDFSAGLGRDIQATYSRALYLAGAPTLFAHLQYLDDAQQRVLLIGHNPGLHQLCLELAPPNADTAWDDLVLSFPTASMAVISCRVPSWGLVVPGAGKLEHFYSRKEIIAPPSAIHGN